MASQNDTPGDPNEPSYPSLDDDDTTPVADAVDDDNEATKICLWLEDKLKQDPGAALLAEVVNKLAVVYANDRHTYQKVRKVLRDHACLREAEKEIRKAVHASVKNIIELPTEEAPEVRVREDIKDAPVHPMAIIPKGWELHVPKAGFFSLLKKTITTFDGAEIPAFIPVCADPIVLTGWASNHTRGTKCLEVAWLGGGKWRRKIVDRTALADGRRLATELSSVGAAVNALNTNDVLRYLADYENKNKELLDVIDLSERMGWQKDGSFLVGHTCIGGETRFLGTNLGEEQLAKGLRSGGSFDAWSSHIGRMSALYPRIELAVYASLATPLLEVVGAPNFALDFSHKTSSGKTTALRVAASVWGCPDERSQASFLQSWDATQVWIERAGSTMSHLPLILDDTKRASRWRGSSIVPSVVYSVAQGHGRGRGDKNEGSRSTATWRTILITSGESSLSDESRDGGTVGRILSLWGSPFGGASDEIGRDVRETNQVVCEHFGHLGPAFVAKLIENRAEWPEFQRRYHVLRAEFAENQSPIGQRVADYKAMIQLTGELAHELLDLGWKHGSPMRQVTADTDHIQDEIETQNDDRPRQALEYAYTWAVSNRDRFWRNFGNNQDRVEWLGRWDEDDTAGHWEWIGFIRGPLEDELRRTGFDVAGVIKIWAENRWLVCDPDRSRRTYSCKISGNRVRVLAVTRAAIELVSD